MTVWPRPSLRHVGRLTDGVGVFEHATGAEPRDDVGYCTDDAGRALALASQCAWDPAATRIADVAMSFLERAHVGGGIFRLRLGPGRHWTADSPSDDAGGRALLGLGTAASIAPWPDVRARALALFDAAVSFRSRWPRALAYAVLGADALLRVAPDHFAARRLVADAARLLPRGSDDPDWPWPEPRLTYANALLTEGLLAVGIRLERTDLADDALRLLDWLVDAETRDEHFSFTPVSGRGPGDPKPAFDQQPIEAWAMADACARAYRWTGDGRWADATRLAASWFAGANDVGIALFDVRTGGAYDGLERNGANRNQGAESALALTGTLLAAVAVDRTPATGADEPSWIRRRASAPRQRTARRADG